MQLTTHINSSQERMAQMEHQLGQVGLVVMGFLEGRLESLMEEEREEGTSNSLGSGGWLLLVMIRMTRVGTQSTRPLGSLRGRS